jgi:hypothetical protein
MTYMSNISDVKRTDLMRKSIICEVAPGGSKENTSVQSDHFVFNPSKIVELTTEESKGVEEQQQLKKSVCLNEYKLFEQFYILGADKKDFLEFDRDSSL